MASLRALLIALVSMSLWPASAIAAAKKSADFCAPDSGVDMADTSRIVTESFAEAMEKVGVTTVARYYDYENETLPGKRLRPEEIPILKSHSLKILVVFQHNNNKAATFIDWKNRGPADAAEALKLAAQFGQPLGSAIYFGVDHDFVGKTTSHTTFFTDEVESYFEEVNRVFTDENAGYVVGVYGSGATCKLLLDGKLAQYCWLSHSHGFVGTKEALADGGYHIEQYLPAECGGRSVDLNDVKAGVDDFGQFTPE